MIAALAAGIAVYWLQEYAYYTPATFKTGAEIELTAIGSGQPETILTDHVEGIDATSSPLRFRACFHTDLSQAMLTETYKVYDLPQPLNGPSWFGCFDAGTIDRALQTGEAIAFLSQADIIPNGNKVQVDRVVAVFPDGRAYAWNQLAPGVEP